MTKVVARSLLISLLATAAHAKVGKTRNLNDEEKTAMGIAKQFYQDEADNFIIGGAAVPAGDLKFYGHFTGATMCGGALFHEDVFVTAAHCLADGFPSIVKIGATTTDPNDGTDVRVCAGIIHPDNDMKAMENDIAILKLCDAVYLNDFEYATWNSDPSLPGATGFDLYAVGFGRTNSSGTLSTYLNKGRFDYLDDDVCKARYNKYNANQNICADAPDIGICYGDSGGPLLDVNNKVFGFASFIIDECASSYPDFFSRISTYDAWIKEMICSEAMSPPSWCSSLPASTVTDGTGPSGSGSADAPAQGGAAGAGGGGGGAGSTDPLTACINAILSVIQSFIGN